MSEHTPNEPAQEKTTLPDDLQAQVKVIEAFTACHQLLQVGQFQFPNFKSVAQSLAFLEALHEKATEEAKKHPQAHLVPELKMESPDGQAQKS